MEMGQWVVGHGSNGSPFLDGSRGSWVTASDPLTHDERTVQYIACNFKYTTYSNTLQRTLFLVDIKKLLTHSIRPIIIAGDLILIYDFLLSRPRGFSSTTMPRPLLVTCMGWNDVMAMGHGSWVMWVMGQLCDGSHGSRKMTHFHLW